MMGKRDSLGFLMVALVAAMGTGCNPQQKAWTGVRMSEDRMDANKAAERVYLAVMAENAMRQDMTVSDLHFVPHTADLNGTGANRLDRMASSLNTYGGMLRYETTMSDDALVNARLEKVREYLSLLGVDMDRVDVKTMISGGRTMPATEAMKIMEAGTKPQANQQQPQPQAMQVGSAPPTP